MTSVLGLAELLLVLLGIMGWCAYELWSLRREPRRPESRKVGKHRRP